MFHFILLAYAYYIKSLSNDGMYVGLSKDDKVAMTKIDTVLDFELEDSSPFVKLKSEDHGYLSVDKNQLKFSAVASLFRILYSFNGGFLISHNNNCLTQSPSKRLLMKSCNSKSNKFIILNNSSSTTGEEIRMKFAGNVYEFDNKVLTETSYSGFDSKDLILKIERFIALEKNRPSLQDKFPRRDFIKINDF